MTWNEYEQLVCPFGCGQLAHADICIPEALGKARKIADDHGKACASWVFDGNTQDSYYAWVLKGIDDGDPLVSNSLPEPRFGDNFNERQLCDEIDVDYDQATPEEVDQITDAYLETARDTFWHEVERLAREHLGKTGD